MFTHILVPVDGSDLSNTALAAALKLAGDFGAKLSVLNVQPPFIPPTVADIPVAMVYPPDDYDKSAERAAREILAAAQAMGEGSGVAVESVYSQHPSTYEAIIETAGNVGADLIVMGSHGRKGLSSLLLGSETNKVLTHCKIPVLIYR